MTFKPRHLAYESVRFGRSKAEKATEPFKNTVYYLWFEYLRRSELYKECCKNGGAGELSDLYADFGDVFSVEFKQWWQTDNRGIELFGEEVAPDTMRIIERKTDLILDDSVMVVSIPIFLPRKFIMKEMKKMLEKAGHAGERGVKTNKESTAKYKVVGGVNRNSLKLGLKLYDMKRANPKMKLYELAREVKIGPWFKPDDSVVRMVLSNLASRHLKKVEKIISNVEVGKFPDVRGTF